MQREKRDWGFIWYCVRGLAGAAVFLIVMYLLLALLFALQRPSYDVDLGPLGEELKEELMMDG